METNLEKFIIVAKKIIGQNNLTIFEFGARDCTETMEFHKSFPDSLIYTFECNKNTLPLCRERVKGIKNITLTEKAVTDRDGEIKFYPIDQEKTVTTWSDGNPGASSIFRASGKYPVEQYVQTEDVVECISLKSFLAAYNLSGIDLLWMDIQGAELIALRGLGERIKDVKLMHLEINFTSIYEGQPFYHEIKKFLNKNGFSFLGFTALSRYSGDAIFINNRLDLNKIARQTAYSCNLLRRKDFYIICLRQGLSQIKKFVFHSANKAIKLYPSLKIFRDYYSEIIYKLKNRQQLFQHFLRARRGILIIQVAHGGLGDHLFFSHIPKIAKESGKYKKVYLAKSSSFRNEETRRLIWDKNPWLDGYSDEDGYAPIVAYCRNGKENLLDRLMFSYGLDDGKRWHEPEIYYKPQLISSLSGKVLYDPNYISNAGELDSALIQNYFTDSGNWPNLQMSIMNHSLPLNNIKETISSSSLENFCDIICSCKKIYCLVTGTATLAAALDKEAQVLYGDNISPIFLHSKKNQYIKL